MPWKLDSLSLSYAESPSRAIKPMGGHITQLRRCEVSALLGTELRGITSLPSGLLLIKKSRCRTLSLNCWGTQKKLCDKDNLEKISPLVSPFIRSLEFYTYSISPCKHIRINMLRCVTVTPRSFIPV